jgi:hypothetical protein
MSFLLTLFVFLYDFSSFAFPFSQGDFHLCRFSERVNLGLVYADAAKA